MGQVLAFGIIALLVAIVSISLIVPTFHWYEVRQEEITFKQQQVSHIIEMRRRIPRLRQEVVALESTLGNERIFLEGRTDAIAGANLQLAIEALAGQSKASLVSITMLPGQNMGRLRQIGINVNLTATWSVLITLLGAIDLAHPRMIVNNLNITAAEQAVISRDIPLQISFNVDAFKPDGMP